MGEWVIFQQFTELLNWTPCLVFHLSVMCKNVILPIQDPNMQPSIQQLPIFICSASVRLSASHHEYVKWVFECLNTGSNSMLFLGWKLLPYNAYAHYDFFLLWGLIGWSFLVISLPRSLIEFCDNCVDANGNQSLWNVKLQKTKSKRADKSPIVIAFLISSRINITLNISVFLEMHLWSVTERA